MLHRVHGPLLIALAATAAVLATLAPDGNGPGATCDELFHVAQGKTLVAALREQGFAFFLPANINQNFPWQPGDPPVQAPLGYWILGGAHYLFDPLPDDPAALSLTAARTAPAIAFGLLILIVGVWTVRREGYWAGTIAAAAVALMPRLFGHAHLASLDMLTTLFFVAAVLAILEASQKGHVWQYALAGIVWGAAILVRLHGLLVAPPVVLWLIWRLRRRAFVPLISWLSAGGITLFVGWPWLWLAPLTRFRQYLASGTDREILHVFYAGRVWTDLDVPWHYPWVMFAVVLPLGFLLLGLLGLLTPLLQRNSLAVSQKSPTTCTFQETSLIIGTILFILLVFSWHGVPVYDGVRLFLMVFPLWAIFVGIGARWLVEHRMLGQLLNNPRVRSVAVFLFVALQGVGLIVYFPCQLSHYSLLVGGLPGAVRLGFEATYWGDTVREPLLAEAARLSPGRPVFFAPNLASFQASAVSITSPALCEAGVVLVELDRSAAKAPEYHRYAVVYHRRADMTDVDWISKHGRVVMEYGNQGVWLSRLVELDAPLDASARQIRIDRFP
jgi:hypothetical protein